jgi:hypothetical protein
VFVSKRSDIRYQRTDQKAPATQNSRGFFIGKQPTNRFIFWLDKARSRAPQILIDIIYPRSGLHDYG